MGAISEFKFGLKYTDHERNVDITYGQTRSTAARRQVAMAAHALWHSPQAT